MRPVQVHPEKSINFTKQARFWCEMINLYKKTYPTHSFKTIAEHFGLTEVNTRRYYYACHHKNTMGRNGQESYTQMRRGACVTI